MTGSGDELPSSSGRLFDRFRAADSMDQGNTF
jgi:hypothetical protein